MCLRLDDVNSFDLKMKLGKGPPLGCNLIVFGPWKATRAERGQGYMYTLCQPVLRGCAGGLTHTLSPQHALALPSCLVPRPRVHAELEVGLQPALHLPKTFLLGGSQEQLTKHPSRSVSRFHTEGACELQPHHCLFPEVGFQIYPWRNNCGTLFLKK